MNREEFVGLAIDERERKYVGTHWNRWVYVLKLIQRLPECPRVLDIGCGGGGMGILLRKSGYNVCGVDIERKESLVWRNRLESFGIDFSFCDITRQKLPFDENAFDLVLLLEVLEHLVTSHPPYQVLHEARRVMKPGSRLLLSTPNAVALHKRFLALLGKNPLSHGFKEDVDYTKHFREYSKEEIRYALARSGFKIEKLMLENFRVPFIYSIMAHYPSFRDTIIVICRK